MLLPIFVYLLGLASGYLFLYLLTLWQHSRIYSDITSFKLNVTAELQRMKLDLEAFRQNAENTITDAKQKIASLVTTEHTS